MREFRTLICLLLVSTLISCAPGAQEEPTPDGSPEAYADSVLSAAFDRWGYFGEEKSPETDTLLPYLVSTELSDRESMEWELDSLRNRLSITSSDDGRVRIFWWLHPGSGTMRQYQSVVCFVDGEGRYHVIPYSAEFDDESVEYSPGAVVSLHHLRDSHYLSLGAGQLMGSMPYQTAGIMTLTPSGIAQSALGFHTRDGSFPALMLDASWYLEHLDEYEHRIPSMLSYDSATRILSFPTILYDTDTRIFVDVIGGGQGVVVDETRPIRMRWVDTGFVEMSGGGVK